MNYATPEDWAALTGTKTRTKHGVRTDPDGIAERTYKGILYDSRVECDYAKYLDFCIDTWQINCWNRQIKVPLLGQDGSVVCRWYADFLVTYPDRSQRYHEVKGRETAVWILKRKLYAATQTPETSLPVIVVRRPKTGGWSFDEVVPARVA